MRGFVSLILPLVVIITLTSLNSVSGTKRKFAPAYCLQLRFNCARESHADHICCKFPLPEGEEAEQAQRKQHPFIKIRPIINKHRPAKPQPEKTEEGGTPVDQDQGSEYLEVEASSETTTTTASTASAFPSRPTRKSSRNRPKVNSNAQPRICKRLSINCQESPEHRCCQQSDNSVEVTTSTTTTTTTTTATPIPAYSEEYPEYSGEYQYSDEIPTECYTAQYDCERDPSHPCCPV